MMQSYDVVIAGGGMTGLALACGLQGTGLRIAVIEKQPSPLDKSPSMQRVSAINAASEHLLTHLGVWHEILAADASPYQGMEVWDKDSFGRIKFSCDTQKETHLGHIVSNEVIAQALWRKASQSSDIALLDSSIMKQVALGENDAFITLEDGRMLTARLVVAADGANSWLRQQADIPVTFWDYQHHAIVATIRCQEPHQGIARQVFHGDGILAFLPLKDKHLCSIVWSLPPETAEKMLALDDAQFNQQLAIAFDNRMGGVTVETARASFPLRGRYARNFAQARLALVGDAAHTIHPLAGLGVNLGFMDVAALIGELRDLHQQGKDIGQYSFLRRYERQRKLAAAKMLATMQGFRELFKGRHPVKKLLRDIGLTLVDKLPGIKTKLLRQAAGLDELPAWLRK